MSLSFVMYSDPSTSRQVYRIRQPPKKRTMATSSIALIFGITARGGVSREIARTILSTQCIGSISRIAAPWDCRIRASFTSARLTPNSSQMRSEME